LCAFDGEEWLTRELELGTSLAVSTPEQRSAKSVYDRNFNGLLAWEVNALGRQLSRLQLERIDEEDAEPTSICSEDVHKVDIQQLMLRKINETEGFILWFDFSRLPNAQGYDFLMHRPPMLPKLDVIIISDEEMHEPEDQSPEAVNPRAPIVAKLAKYAREIASVSRKVLQRVEDGVYTIAEAFDNRPIHQITDEFKRGVINNAEFEWFKRNRQSALCSSS
jgi:hypothetical protein